MTPDLAVIFWQQKKQQIRSSLKLKTVIKAHYQENEETSHRIKDLCANCLSNKLVFRLCKKLL